jgi:DegV family protein with EDD domain
MIKIMLDSSSDSKTNHPYDYYIPLTVDIDGRCYKDGIDLRPQKFYKLLTSAKEFPKTSQPSPDDYMPFFEEAKQNGDEIIYLCVSSNLSGTFQSANIAKEMVEYEKIHIVDTKTVTHLIGMLARHADKLRSEGVSAEEIVAQILELRDKQVVFAGLHTMEYLYKGGRLSKTSAAVGSIANIKPIVTISQEGKVESCAKAIGIKRAISTIIKQIQSMEIDDRFPIWSICTVDTENCEALETALTDAGITINDRMQVGPTIGAHVGPGVYGIAFIRK